MILFPNSVPWCIRVNKKHWNTRKGHTGCVATRKMVFPMVDWKTTDFVLVLKFWNFALCRHVFFWNSKFTIQNPKKRKSLKNRNHHDDHPLSSKSQWQKTTNGNKLYCNVVSNSVIERIGEKKFCKRPFFTVDLLILRTGSSEFRIFATLSIFNGTVHEQQCQ